MNYENLTQARHLADQIATHVALHQHSVRLGRCPTPQVSYRALHDWNEKLWQIKGLVTIKRTSKTKVKLILSARSLWVGVHYSPANRRYCINLLPGVTICITKAGGVEP